MSLTAVVGGGLSGLVCAYTLAKRGRDVVLLEAGPSPGGVVQTEESRGYLLEWGPNTVRPTNALLRLTEELGILGEVLRADPRAPRYVDYGGALHRVPMSPGAFLRTRLLSPRGKLRLLAEPLVPRGSRKAETLRAFVTRRLGREVSERLADPFVAGVFAGDAAQLDVAAAFPRLVELERSHGSLLRGALASRRGGGGSRPPRGLLSFRRGMATLPRALGSALGARLQVGTAVTCVAGEGDRWRLRHAGGDLLCDRVVLAIPSHEAAALVQSLSPEAAAALRAIPYPPLAVLQLSYPAAALERPLDGFGHLVAPQPERRILGAVWSSSLFPDRAPPGRVLLTVFAGGTRDPRAPLETDEALLAIADKDLSPVIRTKTRPEIVALRRYERAIPQYVAGHSQRIHVLEETEARNPGLTFLGNYRGGISVGDVLDSAERAASSLDEKTG